jgi:hypothetical protein
MSDGGRAWILPQSGTSDFANNMYVFQFEELQIYGNGHLAVLNPGEITVFDTTSTSIICCFVIGGISAS